MVRTRNRVQTTLTAAALGATLASGVTLAVLLGGSPAAAQGETSSAFGVSASGVDPVGAQPSVSSSGEVKTASGSVSGKAGTFTASGITVKAGAGIAEASVAKVTVGGVSIGPVSAKCNNGVTTYSGGGPAAPSSNVKVSYGGGAGAVITVVGAGGKAAETITVAVAKCGKGTPPTTNPPTNPPTGQPTNPPTGKPTGSNPTTKPTGTNPNTKPEQPAPKPQPHDGHHPVTG
ncbi:hypothetical protein [Actinokineospora enzanensis]|uniref:hypothetical protein n=1 Tax=Actinokineospora enzanensis TaxID=155975 RepID=UPI00036A5CD4|nr:hypothetical protein [Actinokineospora enzanensis]